MVEIVFSCLTFKRVVLVAHAQIITPGRTTTMFKRTARAEAVLTLAHRFA